MMKKLTILIDMDDTLENLCAVWVAYLNKKHDLNVKLNDIKEWNMSKAFPMLPESEIYEPLRDKELWKKVKPLPGAVKYVKKIKEDGHRVFVVTASNPCTVGVKLLTVLFRYFPYLTYKDVIVTTNKQMIKGDIMIDDAPHNLEGGTYHGILMNASHNRSYDAKKHGFERAGNWKEIYRLVRKYAAREGGESD